MLLTQSVSVCVREREREREIERERERERERCLVRSVCLWLQVVLIYSDRQCLMGNQSCVILCVCYFSAFDKHYQGRGSYCNPKTQSQPLTNELRRCEASPWLYASFFSLLFVILLWRRRRNLRRMMIPILPTVSSRKLLSRIKGNHSKTRMGTR